MNTIPSFWVALVREVRDRKDPPRLSDPPSDKAQFYSTEPLPALQMALLLKHTFPPEKTSRLLKITEAWALSLCNSVKYNLSWQIVIWFKGPLSYIIKGDSKELMIYFYWFSNLCWIVSPNTSPLLRSFHQSLMKFNFISFFPLPSPSSF